MIKPNELDRFLNNLNKYVENNFVSELELRKLTLSLVTGSTSLEGVSFKGETEKRIHSMIRSLRGEEKVVIHNDVKFLINKLDKTTMESLLNKNFGHKSIESLFNVVFENVNPYKFTGVVLTKQLEKVKLSVEWINLNKELISGDNVAEIEVIHSSDFHEVAMAIDGIVKKLSDDTAKLLLDSTLENFSYTEINKSTADFLVANLSAREFIASNYEFDGSNLNDDFEFENLNGVLENIFERDIEINKYIWNFIKEEQDTIKDIWVQKLSEKYPVMSYKNIAAALLKNDISIERENVVEGKKNSEGVTEEVYVEPDDNDMKQYAISHWGELEYEYENFHYPIENYSFDELVELENIPKNIDEILEKMSSEDISSILNDEEANVFAYIRDEYAHKNLDWLIAMSDNIDSIGLTTISDYDKHIVGDRFINLSNEKYNLYQNKIQDMNEFIEENHGAFDKNKTIAELIDLYNNVLSERNDIIGKCVFLLPEFLAGDKAISALKVDLEGLQKQRNDIIETAKKYSSEGLVGNSISQLNDELTKIINSNEEQKNLYKKLIDNATALGVDVKDIELNKNTSATQLYKQKIVQLEKLINDKNLELLEKEKAQKEKEIEIEETIQGLKSKENK